MIKSTTTATHTIERDVHANGVRLRVREAGPASAPPVMILHGIMGHRREWDVLVDRLSQRHRVIAVDQRGHGRSEWTHSYRAVDMARDATALIEALGIERATLVGHSMGAIVALIAAARRPDLIDRIVAIDIVPESLETELAAQMPSVLEAMVTAAYATLGEAFTEWHAANPRARPDLLMSYLAHALVPHADGRLRWGFDAHGLSTFFSGVSTAELWAAIDATHCPALLVRGEKSTVTTPGLLQAVAERLGDARCVEIGAAGHDIGVERPEAVADVVLAFLADRTVRPVP